MSFPNRSRFNTLNTNGKGYFYQLLRAKAAGDSERYNSLVDRYTRDKGYSQGPAAVAMAETVNVDSLPDVDWNDTATYRAISQWARGNRGRSDTFTADMVTPSSPATGGETGTPPSGGEGGNPFTTVLEGAQPGQVIGAEQGWGRYGDGLIVAEDGSGFYSHVTPETLQDLRDNGVAPAGINPSLLNSAETIRLRMQGYRDFGPATTWNDNETGLGVRFDNGNFSSGSIVPPEGTPTFIGNRDPGGSKSSGPGDEGNTGPPSSTDPGDGTDPGNGTDPFDPPPPSGTPESGGGIEWNWDQFGAPPLEGGGGYDPQDYLFDSFVPGQDSPWGIPDAPGGNADFYRNQLNVLNQQNQRLMRRQERADQMRQIGELVRSGAERPEAVPEGQWNRAVEANRRLPMDWSFIEGGLPEVQTGADLAANNFELAQGYNDQMTNQEMFDAFAPSLSEDNRQWLQDYWLPGRENQVGLATRDPNAFYDQVQGFEPGAQSAWTDVMDTIYSGTPGIETIIPEGYASPIAGMPFAASQYNGQGPLTGWDGLFNDIVTNPGRYGASAGASNGR